MLDPNRRQGYLSDSEPDTFRMTYGSVSFGRARPHVMRAGQLISVLALNATQRGYLRCEQCMTVSRRNSTIPLLCYDAPLDCFMPAQCISARFWLHSLTIQKSVPHSRCSTGPIPPTRCYRSPNTVRRRDSPIHSNSTSSCVISNPSFAFKPLYIRLVRWSLTCRHPYTSIYLMFWRAAHPSLPDPRRRSLRPYNEPSDATFRRCQL